MPNCCVRLLVSAGLVLAAFAAQAKVYPCVGPRGEKVMQDTPCRVIEPPPPPPPAPPCPLTPGELRQAVRQEEQFLKRYGDEQAHRRSQVADLQAIATRLRSATPRLEELRLERKRIEAEMQFHPKGKPLPARLQADLDANEAQFAALADIYRQLELEIVGVDKRYTCDRDTFAKMWTGAAPGSSGCARPECSRGWSLPP